MRLFRSSPVQPCCYCQQPVRLEEPHWQSARGPAHYECVDFSQLEFPFKTEQAELRARFRRLQRTLQVVTEVGQWLRAAQRRWPLDAAQTLREWPKHQARVEASFGLLLDLVRKRNEQPWH